MNRLLLALPLLAACATAPAPTRPAPEPLPADAWVDLRFGWRPGTSATVEITHARTAPGPEGQERAELAVRSRLETEAVPGGLAVHTKDLDLEGPPIPTPAGVELLAAELAAPDLVVGPAGNLLAVEARPTARTELGEALVQLSRAGSVPTAFRDRILERLEHAELRARADDDWDRLVGFWAGASLQAGRVYTARDLVGLDLLADLPVEAEVRMRLVDLVPCEAGEAVARCAELELTVVADEAGTAGLVPFLSRLFGNRDGAPKLSYEERSLLVAEPAGLVPHRLTTTRRVAVAFENGADRFEREDERTVRFTYPAAAAAESSSAGTRSSSQRASSSR